MQDKNENNNFLEKVDQTDLGKIAGGLGYEVDQEVVIGKESSNTL